MKNRGVSFFTSGSLVIGSAILFLGAVAFAAIVSGTSTTNISAHVTYTQLTINKPTVSAGNVMVASVAILDGNIGNVTAPQGWTQIARTDNDVNVTLISYWKVASASEPSSYTWTIDEQTKAVGGITPYTGVDATNPIDAVAGNTGFSTTATTSAITATTPNEEVVALFATDVSKTFSTPTGMTEKYDLSHTAAGPSTAADDAIQTSAGTVSSKSSTITGNKARNWSAQVIALRQSAITFDSSAAGAISSVTSAGPSISITRGTGATNYIGIASILGNCAISSMTWGGSAMTEFMDVAANGGEDRLYYIVNPPAGTQSVTAGVTGSCGMQAVTYSGVSQTTPLDTNFDGASHSFVASLNSSVAPANDITLTGTTHLDRSLAVGFVDMNISVSAGSNAVERIPNGVYEAASVTTPAGSVSLGIHNNSGSTQEIDGYLFGLQPAN